MFIKCDGPFGDNVRIAKDATESVEVVEIVNPDDSDAEHLWQVLVNTYVRQHLYGSYFDPKDADNAADYIVSRLDGHPAEPIVRLGEELLPISELLERRIPHASI